MISYLEKPWTRLKKSVNFGTTWLTRIYLETYCAKYDTGYDAQIVNWKQTKYLG